MIGHFVGHGLRRRVHHVTNALAVGSLLFCLGFIVGAFRKTVWELIRKAVIKV